VQVRGAPFHHNLQDVVQTPDVHVSHPYLPFRPALPCSIAPDAGESQEGAASMMV
jgi:hypothetical protein